MSSQKRESSLALVGYGVTAYESNCEWSAWPARVLSCKSLMLVKIVEREDDMEQDEERLKLWSCFQ